jgi:hypothetical protein
MKVEHKIDEKGRKSGCPTGQCCDVCNLYRPLYQSDEKGGITQQFDCTWNNLMTLMGETKNRVQGVQGAVESARNESVQRQDKLLNMVHENASLPSQ